MTGVVLASISLAFWVSMCFVLKLGDLHWGRFIAGITLLVLSDGFADAAARAFGWR